MDASLLCEDKTAVFFTGFLFCVVVFTKLSLISTRVLIACMCFHSTLHLSVCCYVDMYALVHIERRVALDAKGQWTTLKVKSYA